MSGGHSVALLCTTLGVSRGGYYAWQQRRLQPCARVRENEELTLQIRTVFGAMEGRYGSPRIARELGCPGSRNRIARLMHVHGIWARQKSKYRVRTTDSRHGGPIAPNRLPELTVTAPDQAWGSDATCVLTGQGWLYVVVMLDLCSRRVLGWAMGANLDAQLMLDALQMAMDRRHPKPGLVVHSDRGAQYASADYRQLLAKYGLLASMSRKGNCYDNAFVESFWSSLKYETVYHRRFATRTEAKAALFDYIEVFYNRIRLHSSLGYLSPITFESQLN
jgi:transposase InsO family protein